MRLPVFLFGPKWFYGHFEKWPPRKINKFRIMIKSVIICTPLTCNTCIIMALMTIKNIRYIRVKKSILDGRYSAKNPKWPPLFTYFRINAHNF